MGITIKNMEVNTEDELPFIDELEAICRKYAGNDYFFKWEGDGEKGKGKSDREKTESLLYDVRDYLEGINCKTEAEKELIERLGKELERREMI